MEAVLAWWNGFFQGIQWGKMESWNLGMLDFILAGLLLLGVVYGARRGPLRMLVEMFEFSAVIFLTLANYDLLVQTLQRSLRLLPAGVIPPIAFFILFSLIWAAIIVIDQTLRQWFQVKTLGVLKIVGGGFLGMVYFLMVFSMVSKGLTLMPNQHLKRVYESGQSHFGPAALAFSTNYYAKVNFTIGELLKSK